MRSMRLAADGVRAGDGLAAQRGLSGRAVVQARVDATLGTGRAVDRQAHVERGLAIGPDRAAPALGEEDNADHPALDLLDADADAQARAGRGAARGRLE